MKIYQVMHNNGEAWEDNYEYAGGTYTSIEEAEKEILHDGYMIKADWDKPYENGKYVVDKDSWAKDMNNNLDMDSDCTEDYYKPEDCHIYDWAVIKELELLEIFRDEVAE